VNYRADPGDLCDGYVLARYEVQSAHRCSSKQRDKAEATAVYRPSVSLLFRNQDQYVDDLRRLFEASTHEKLNNPPKSTTRPIL
jgi:hypothetical protein